MNQGRDTLICAWCGALMDGNSGASAVSHGICVVCIHEQGLLPVEDLHRMSGQQADRLPYGRLLLDDEGIIRAYNRRESEHAGLPADSVIGRQFFTDVAPCTQVGEFGGRFQAMVGAGVPDRATFSFVFDFQHGRRAVNIALAYRPGLGTVVLIREFGQRRSV